MASSCGIHIDQRRFHLIALEGSVRKHRVVTRASGEIPFGADPVEEVARALRKIAKENKLKVDNVGLAVDSGLAAFRNLTLPFDDRSKIEEVLKFEVESELPQWDIDDVIVDFLVLSSKPGVESNLLVTAILETRLRRQLEACEKGGLEATEAELDGTALFEAAHAAGVLTEDAAQILIHVGDSSTTVVVADGGRLSSIRAIRAGAIPHGPPPFEAGDGGEEGEGDEEGAGDAPDAEHEEQVRERLHQTSRRIRRELGRTLSGAQTANPIQAIYVCGHPLGDLREEALFDVPIEPLEAVPSGDDEPSAQELTIAYGAALRQLGGGVLRPRLRREGLRFTGKFERIELPLAVFSLLLLTLLLVELIVINKQISYRDEGTKWSGDMQIWLERSKEHLLPDPKTGYSGRLKDPPEDVERYIETAVKRQDEGRTKFQEIQRVRQLLQTHVVNLKKELNIGDAGADVKQPLSALEGATLVLRIVDAVGKEIGKDAGRYGIRLVQADYQQGRQDQPDEVEVRLDMDFFADDALTATRHYNALKRACESEPWCLEFAERPTKPFEDGGGISVDGMSIRVNVEAAQRTQT